jgi:hypothetical protein
MFRTDDGLVNLDHVGEVRVVSNGTGKDKEYNTLFYASRGGHRIAEKWGHNLEEVRTLCCSYVAAAPGDEVLSIEFWLSDSDEALRPTRADVHVARHSVVAWRIEEWIDRECIGIPVLADDMAENILVPMPDGRLSVAGDAMFDSLESAIAEFLKRAQWSWDQEHPAKAVTDAEEAA